jgi:hypothetical protein
MWEPVWCLAASASPDCVGLKMEKASKPIDSWGVTARAQSSAAWQDSSQIQGCTGSKRSKDAVLPCRKVVM